MKRLKERTGGLGKFLSEVVEVEKEPEQIIYIDIENIESNPRNFYGLRDIEGLAGLIAVSHMIEPLTVTKKENGKYMLISGHRRRAAVQKLLEEGTYTERKLPCIVKARKKIKIEEDDGKFTEFDEDAVEMLNLIASNRGQREERTVDEKLQEVKYLEAFAKAIYNQKDRRNRGRFRTFFAEEILNISTTQLQRMKSMEKLSDSVKKTLEDGKINESAAAEFVSMTIEEQEKCLEKIISGEMSGTVQDIRRYKQGEKNVNDVAIGIDDDTVREVPPEETVEENNSDIESSAEIKNIGEGKEEKGFLQDISSKSEEISEITNIVNKIIDIPENFDDPQKEAKEWFYQEKLRFYQMKYEEAKRMKENEINELKAAQWGIRASVALYDIEELKLTHKK